MNNFMQQKYSCRMYQKDGDNILNELINYLPAHFNNIAAECSSHFRREYS